MTPGCAVKRKAPDPWLWVQETQDGVIVLLGASVTLGYMTLLPYVFFFIYNRNNNSHLARLESEMRANELGRIHLKLPFFIDKNGQVLGMSHSLTYDVKDSDQSSVYSNSLGCNRGKNITFVDIIVWSQMSVFSRK